jgi:hypothetical protein
MHNCTLRKIGIPVFAAILLVLGLGSCSSFEWREAERIGPLFVEYKRGTAAPSEVDFPADTPSYHAFSMAHTASEDFFRRLELYDLLSPQEQVRFIERCFSLGSDDAAVRELRFRLPAYFSQGGPLLLTVGYQEGPPDRFEWRSNATADPLSGKAVRSRPIYKRSGNLFHPVEGEIVVIGNRLIRPTEMYSYSQELRLRARGELLLLAYLNLLDETTKNDDRAGMVAELVLRAGNQSFERLAVAHCVKSIYLLTKEDYRAADRSLARAKDHCSDAPAYITSLYRSVEIRHRLTMALRRRRLQ